jgi:hypothetical protein
MGGVLFFWRAFTLLDVYYVGKWDGVYLIVQQYLFFHAQIRREMTFFLFFCYFWLGGEEW